MMTIRMKVLAEKHKELSQTIRSLADAIRTEKGCKRCDFCRNAEDENDLWLLERWDSEKSLQTHIKSDIFRILQGTANLLREPSEISFSRDFVPGGAKEDQDKATPSETPDNIVLNKVKSARFS